MADDIRISSKDLAELANLTAQLDDVKSFVTAERLNRLSTDIRTAVTTVMKNREELERFFRYKASEEDKEFFSRASQAITGASAGFGQGLEFGSQIGSPQAGAIAAVVLSIIGATLGVQIEDDKRESDRRIQALEDAQFGFKQRLKRDLKGLKKQDAFLREFSKRDAADFRARNG